MTAGLSRQLQAENPAKYVPAALQKRSNFNRRGNGTKRIAGTLHKAILEEIVPFFERIGLQKRHSPLYRTRRSNCPAEFIKIGNFIMQ